MRRVPADLVAGSELVTTGVLEKTTGAEGSVQLQVLTTKPGAQTGLRVGYDSIGIARPVLRGFQEVRAIKQGVDVA